MGKIIHIQPKQAPKDRRTSLRGKWPRSRWMNAFSVQEEHDLEIMRLETEAMVAVFGDRRAV